MHNTSLFPLRPEYDDREREQVTLPHTFNGSDLFSVRIGTATPDKMNRAFTVRCGPVRFTTGSAP